MAIQTTQYDIAFNDFYDAMGRNDMAGVKKASEKIRQLADSNLGGADVAAQAMMMLHQAGFAEIVKKQTKVDTPEKRLIEISKKITNLSAGSVRYTSRDIEDEIHVLESKLSMIEKSPQTQAYMQGLDRWIEEMRRHLLMWKREE
jgi:hypothetical protein